MSKLHYGRLTHDLRMDNWEIITPDGVIQIQPGERVTLGHIGGIQVYGILTQDGGITTWALTQPPSQIVEGMTVALWRRQGDETL